MKYEVQIIEVTVAMAQAWLDHNPRNRHKSPAKVWKLVHDQVTGQWKFNGASIVISEKGDLLDGQHRLQAIVESGIPQMVVVVTGVEDSAIDTIDIGDSRTLVLNI